ncbi:MAG: ABC transporter ATP-binding protein [Microbacteriaceae bacterium]|nr:ABC transporter ATP-binding protein [Microbacteriaceae bacterium]
MSSPRFGGFRRGGTPVDPSGPKATFGQLMPYLLEHKRILGVVIVLSLLGAAASLGQPLIVAQVISTVQAGTDLGWLVPALIALVIGSAILSSVRHYLLQRTGESVVLSSRRHLVARLLNLPISQFDARRTGDLVSRVGADSTMLRAVLTQGLVEAIGGLVTFVGSIIAMLIIDMILFGLTFSVVVSSMVIVIALSRRIRVYSRRAQDRVGDLTASVERAISAVRTVRAANAVQREIDTVDDDSRGAWRAGLDVARISAFVIPISGIAMQVSFLVVLGVGGFRVASGAIDVAQLVSFILFLFMMIMPLGQAIGAFTSVAQALGALGRIQEIIDLPSESANDVVTDTLDGELGEIAIEFDSVNFAYDPETPILTNISFTVKTGTRIALVGPSGSGKSTILSLIERFYDPQSGTIRLGGHDIRALDRTELRSAIGYVEQDAPVLAGSIRDNLILGAPNATDADCLAVLDEVNLANIVDRDERGIHSPVGEGGVLLSGGERQRLAIARALLAAAPILLLDESTSSLDGLNEQLMKDAIDRVSAQRTLIVIAHRLSTVIDSDQIVVLSKGEVLGIGTHEQLLTVVPLYRELAETQLLSPVEA